MAVLQEKSTVVVFKFSFKAPRREKILNASKEFNESREGHSLPVCFWFASFEQTVLDKNCLALGNQISFSAYLKDKQKKKSLTLILHFLFLNVEYFVHG